MGLSDNHRSVQAALGPSGATWSVKTTPSTQVFSRCPSLSLLGECLLFPACTNTNKASKILALVFKEKSNN